MAVQASKSISLTVNATGGTLKLSANQIVKFTASGSNTLLTYINSPDHVITKLMTEDVATINTAAARTQAVTLANATSTVLYIHSDKIIYLDTTNTTGTIITYWNPGVAAPEQIVVTEDVGVINSTAGNTFAITPQTTGSGLGAVRYINNLFVQQINVEAIDGAASLSAVMIPESYTVSAPGTGYTSLPTVAVTGGGGTGATATATNLRAITGVGADAGTVYVPAQTITLTGGTFSAAAVLTVATTEVVSATVAAGGASGTPGTQTVTGTTGTGTKFQASVTVDGGGAISAVLSITVAGSYTVNPTDIAVEPVTGAGLVGAQLAVVMGVDTATVTTPGVYTVLPSNPVSQGSSSGSGTGATFTMAWGLNAIALGVAGTGFTSMPTVTVSGGGGTGATASAVMEVEAVTVVDGGSNYNSVPTVAFTGGGGSLAAATAAIAAGAITSVTVTDAGGGYTSFPTVSASGGAGAQITYDEKRTGNKLLQVDQTAAALQTTINAL